MGNEQSVPAPAPAVEDRARSRDPAIVAGDSTKDPPNDVTESTNISALAIETDNVKFNDGLPTPPATSHDLLAPVSPEPCTAPIGNSRQNAGSRDKRPAFLRRLTTTTSAVLTAQTHAENVTATPTSPSPEKTLKSVAKEQLNTVSGPHSRSVTNPSVTDKEDYFLSPGKCTDAKAVSPSATCPPGLAPENKELGQSLSSFQLEERARSERARWNAPRSGSVSPLSCDNLSDGHPELQDQDLDGAESQMTGGIPAPPRETAFDGTRPVAFSVDDWAWRMEFLPSEASDDDADIDPEFFPLPDGDDESFADDELSFLDPGRESALRGESRNEDYHPDYSLVRTTSSAESTQKAPSLIRSEQDAGVITKYGDENQLADVTNGASESEAPKNKANKKLEEAEDKSVDFKAAMEDSMVEDMIEKGSVEMQESEECSHQDERQNKNKQALKDKETPPDVNHEQGHVLVRIPPESPALDASPQSSRKVVEPDSHRDSAMYQFSLDSPRDIEQLQTIKEPEPADQRKRMSLASIEDIAGELSFADFDAAEAKSNSQTSQGVELSKDEEPAEDVTSDRDDECTGRKPEHGHFVVGSQPAEANPNQDEPQRVLQPEVAETIPVAPTFELSLKRDDLSAADQRPVTAHPSPVAAETSSRPLTAPSNPIEVSETVAVREKSKSWRKTWPTLVNRATRSKSEASRNEKTPNKIPPAPPVPPKNDASTLQKQADDTEQPKKGVNDDSNKPSKTSGLASKIPTPAEQSKSKEKKKRGSILGSLFRHSSTKDEKPKSKETTKLEKANEKESKPSKKSSKVAKGYRRSSKPQMEGDEDKQKESATPLSRPMTAMAILNTQMVDEPLTLEPKEAKGANGTEGILNHATEKQRTGSAGKGKYGLPSASLGIPTLLQSPARKKQNHAEGTWFHRRSAPPQQHTTGEAQLPRRASMGIFGGSNNGEERKGQRSHLPQARPAQPQNRRASVHVPQNLPLRANPLLPSVEDSPYARATTGIPQPSTSKISSYPDRNQPYRGIARTNSSPLQGISSASQSHPQPQPQVQAQSPRAGPTRIPSPSLSQVPVGRRSVAPRLPSQQRMFDVRPSNTFSASSQAGLGLAPGMDPSTSDSSKSRKKHGDSQETLLKGTGVTALSPHQSFVAELADTDVGRRGSEEINMRATSYPGMEWVPEDMQ